MARELELKIEKVVFGGDGMGHLDGKVCFVPRVIAGEKAFVRILSEKKNFSRAKLLHLVESSNERLNPPCPYVHQCGGCQYQHMSYPEELRTKENQVRETLGKSLSLSGECFQPITHAEKYYGYRTSITLHKTSEDATPQRLAYVGQDNESAVWVDECLLAHKKLEPVFTQLHTLSRYETSRTFKITGGGEIVSSNTQAVYSVKIGKTVILTHAAGFFQNNLEVTELVSQRLRAWVQETGASRFLDLYAGAGTFSILAASNLAEIFCFEENPYSVKCLAENLSALTGPRIKEGIAGRVETVFPRWFKENSSSSRALIFMDPPRQGIAENFTDWLNRETPAGEIAYLACDLAILARDLKRLTAGGNYTVQTVIPFDMFPRTKHIETLVFLKRREKA